MIRMKKKLKYEWDEKAEEKLKYKWVRKLFIGCEGCVICENFSEVREEAF